MKKGNIERQVMTMYKTKLTDKQETNGKIFVVTQHTVTLPPYHISIVPLMAINYAANMHTNTLIEIDDNPFFSIEQPNITIIPALQKLDSQTPDKFMAILWIQGSNSVSIKNMTIGCIKESQDIEKS